jgi:hypothetical protein
MGKPISGIGKRSNLDKWASYSKKNSYGDNDRQGKSQLDSRDKTQASDGPTSVRNREGRGWAEFTSYCQAESTFTDKGGNKRD